MWHEINFYWWLAELPQIGLKPFLAKILGICLMQGEIDNFYLKCEVELMLTSHLSDSSLIGVCHCIVQNHYSFIMNLPLTLWNAFEDTQLNPVQFQNTNFVESLFYQYVCFLKYVMKVTTGF